MTALLTLEEIKAHLRVDHDADDDMLMDKVRQATAVLLAYIQGSRDKVIREDGELIPGEALTRMKGAAMRLTGMLYRNRILRSGKNCFRGAAVFCFRADLRFALSDGVMRRGNGNICRSSDTDDKCSEPGVNP